MKQGLHHDESPNWWMGIDCVDSHSPLIKRPHFLEISMNILAEWTFLPFAAVALWATVMAVISGQQEVGTVHGFLLEPTDC